MLGKEEIIKIKKELHSMLKGDESINDLLEGLYSGIKIIQDKQSGVLFLSNKRLFFISYYESNIKYEEILYDDIISVQLKDGKKYKEIIIELENNSITFKALNSDESVVDFINNFKSIINQKKDKVFKNFDFDSKYSDDSNKYDFLFLESKKLNIVLEKYLNINPKIFCENLINDLITVSLLALQHKKRLSNEEIFFMTITLLPLHPKIDLKIKEKIKKILNGDSFNLKDISMVKEMWPKVARFFPEKVEEDSTLLLSLEYLKKIDKEEGTIHYDKIRTVFFNYVQCLIKADGRVTEEEMRIGKKINSLIYCKESDNYKVDLKNKKDINESIENKSPTIPEETLETVMKEINNLVGMKNIKDQIKTLVNLIKIKKEREVRKLPISKISLHAVFYGPPGTGKTTIARLLGKVYKYLGLLSKGHIIETDRAGLVAGYVGQTAIQVDKVVGEALDGVLFIDEAYSLKSSNGSNDFGQEAIETILKRMEDYRDRLVIIVAGYPDEMKEFIESNPGLKSRFSRYFYFKDYTPDELLKIFNVFCKNAVFKITKKAKAKLLELFKSLYLKKDRTFGNGRLVRNIFERIIENQANRLVKVSPLTDEVLSTIEESDIPKEIDLIK